MEAISRFDVESRRILDAPTVIADALIAETLQYSKKKRSLDSALMALAIKAEDYLERNTSTDPALQRQAANATRSSLSTSSGMRHPFHWPLEFPEVMVTGRHGFDAIVGNPPYINAVELYSGEQAEQLKSFYGSHYATARGSYDIYVLFWERAFQLSAGRSSIGLLVPNKLLSAEYAEELRSYIITRSRIHAIIDFSRARAFAAGVYPVSCIATRPRTDISAQVILDKGRSGKAIGQAALRNAPDLLWGYVLTDYADLLATAMESCVPLRNFATVVGSATVAEAYEIAGIVQSNESGQVPNGHKRFVVSGNIRPFRTTWDDCPVQYLKRRFTRPSVPLIGLPSQGRRNQAQSPKIILSGLSRRPTAFLDSLGEYCAGKSTVLVMVSAGAGDAVVLQRLAYVLNSKVAALVYKALYGGLALGGGYLRFGPPQIAAFPVPRQLLADQCCDSEDAVSEAYGVDPREVDAAFQRAFSTIVDGVPQTEEAASAASGKDE